MPQDNNPLLDVVNCISLAKILERRKKQNKRTPKFVKEALKEMRDKAINTLRVEIEVTKAEDAETKSRNS